MKKADKTIPRRTFLFIFLSFLIKTIDIHSVNFKIGKVFP